jgi:hypothetical protein
VASIAVTTTIMTTTIITTIKIKIRSIREKKGLKNLIMLITLIKHTCKTSAASTSNR